MAELSPSQVLVTLNKAVPTQNHTERVEPAGSQPEDAACSSQVTPTSWLPSLCSETIGRLVIINPQKTQVGLGEEHLIWCFYHSIKALLFKRGRNLEEKASNTSFDLIHIISRVHFTLIPRSLKEVALMSAGSLFSLKLIVTSLWSDFTEIPDPRFYCRNTKYFIFEKHVRQLSSQTVTISPRKDLSARTRSPGSWRDLAHMQGDWPSWWDHCSSTEHARPHSLPSSTQPDQRPLPTGHWACPSGPHS